MIMAILLSVSCDKEMNNPHKNLPMGPRIILLHHSTGEVIWYGNTSSMKSIYLKLFRKESVTEHWFRKYNKENGTSYQISELKFPKKEPYGWNNYPYDYYNIWVKHAGENPYMEEPTLEMLTREYDVIIFKHCYPVSNMEEDTGKADIDSDKKTMENYVLQYNALKKKMHEFPETRFIVWTGAALVESWTTEENARRAREFFNWVRTEWDEQGDNIFLWDLYTLETEGGLYLKPEYARTPNNPHPHIRFAGKVNPLFCSRIVDVIENNGSNTMLTGEK